MTILEALAALCRFLGLVAWADGLWKKHELNVKAKAVADAPKTKAELLDTLDRGDL